MGNEKLGSEPKKAVGKTKDKKTVMVSGLKDIGKPISFDDFGELNKKQEIPKLPTTNLVKTKQDDRASEIAEIKKLLSKKNSSTRKALGIKTIPTKKQFIKRQEKLEKRLTQTKSESSYKANLKAESKNPKLNSSSKVKHGGEAPKKLKTYIAEENTTLEKGQKSSVKAIKQLGQQPKLDKIEPAASDRHKFRAVAKGPFPANQIKNPRSDNSFQFFVQDTSLLESNSPEISSLVQDISVLQEANTWQAPSKVSASSLQELVQDTSVLNSRSKAINVVTVQKKPIKHKSAPQGVVSSPVPFLVDTSPQVSERHVLEAALFMSPKSLTMDDLIRVSGIGSVGYLSNVLNSLQQEYLTRGINITNTQEGWHMKVRPDIMHRVGGLTPYTEIPDGCKRTLALVIYKEPLKQSKLIEMQGSKAYAYVKVLLKKGMLRAEKAGRTKILRLSKEAEQYLGVDRENLKALIAQSLKEAEKKAKETQQPLLAEPDDDDE